MKGILSMSGYRVLVFAVLTQAAAFGAAQVQVNFDSGSESMFDQLNALLSPGSAADGDGAIIQLGYYDGASVSNNFVGAWHPLTGAGSLNTGGDTGSGLPFTSTSIGDIGGGAAPGGSGIFAFSLVFDDTVAGTFNDLPGAITIPLAIRFFNGTTLGSSTHFNVVSHDAWLWKLPATPSPLPPTINMSLGDAGLEWRSIAVAGQPAGTAFHTSLAVPEPGAGLLAGFGLAVLAMRRRREGLSALAAAVALGGDAVLAHSPDDHQVSIVEKDGRRIIAANGIPDHAPGEFPRRGNPNRIAAQNYRFEVSLKPEVAAKFTPTGRAWFGVALNGVPFEAGTAEYWGRDWNYEAIAGSLDLGLDEHRAHVQPSGAYHYHGLPTGLIAKFGSDAGKMLLVGWAADGFPIYTERAHARANDAESPLQKMRSSYRLKAGTRPGGPDGPGGKYDGAFTADYEYVAGSGDLDECHGRTGLTPEFPGGTYYYCVTEEFPFVSRMWRGTADRSFMKSGPGMGPPGGRRGPPGRGLPPRGL